MAVNVNLGVPKTYENIEVQVLSITTDKLENKLHKLLPKVDNVSNWISFISILITILFGILAYFSTDAAHRPALWASILAFLGILTGCVISVILLIKGYKCLSVEEMMEEFKDGCSFVSKDGTQKEYHKKSRKRRR